MRSFRLDTVAERWPSPLSRSDGMAHFRVATPPFDLSSHSALFLISPPVHLPVRLPRILPVKGRGRSRSRTAVMRLSQPVRCACPLFARCVPVFTRFGLSTMTCRKNAARALSKAVTSLLQRTVPANKETRAGSFASILADFDVPAPRRWAGF